jgi:hypothetical protein
VPNNPDKSPLYTLTILPKGHDDIMPPKGDPLTKEQTETLKQWILAGATWPENLTINQRKKEVKDNSLSDLATAAEIHKEILAGNSVKTEKEMKPYTRTIPGTPVDFAMVPIPSGQFVMGSPAS